MFPDVGAIMVSPGFKIPSLSASSTIRMPMRSFTDPPGLKNSHFPTATALSIQEAAKKERGEEEVDREWKWGLRKKGRKIQKLQDKILDNRVYSKVLIFMGFQS